LGKYGLGKNNATLLRVEQRGALTPEN